MTRYFVAEQDLIDISEALMSANDYIYSLSDELPHDIDKDWDAQYTSVESLIEHIFKTQKL